MGDPKYDDNWEPFDIENEKDYRCWACGTLFMKREGFSIDDSGIEQVCLDCWNLIPIDKKLWLSFFFRMGDNGGVGLKDLFENAVNEYGFIKKFGTRPENPN